MLDEIINKNYENYCNELKWTFIVDKIIENELEAISDAAENQDGFIKLSVGKKRHLLIKLI